MAQRFTCFNNTELYTKMLVYILCINEEGAGQRGFKHFQLEGAHYEEESHVS